MAINILEAHYRDIEAAMAHLQRTSWRAIAPGEVLDYLKLHLPEKQIRNDMDEMVGLGRLVKVGRGHSRGYRLATATQRAAHAKKYGLRPRGDVRVSEYTELVYQAIENAVAKAYRDLGRGVLPRDIQARLPYDRAEGSLRRDCLAMHSAGRIIRVEGYSARQGYRPPTRMERLSFSINQGMWPYGSESVQLGLQVAF